MTGPDIHRLTAGTIAFQMRLHRPRWSYGDEQLGRLVDVEVEISALEELADAIIGDAYMTPTLVGKRHVVERAARRIIDREGPNFVEPVRVTARDV